MNELIEEILTLMTKESEQFASEYDEFQKIFEDEYQVEMIRATQNIKKEVDKADTPYLGTDVTPIIDESLATIDLSEK